MVNLSTFYNLNIYNTEGKYIGKVSEVVLNIKKGRISFFKTKALTEDNRNVGLRDVLRNSMRLVPEEEEMNQVRTEGIIDIPYEMVVAVGDIIIIDHNKLAQYQSAQQQASKVNSQKISQPKKTMPKAN
ncbi:PRC-barrel domain-containing protein [Methanosphaera sp. WGK6]|uniref:PRC-barrel domain-containing protein n=1 Tax=Methanosphaera sp. WGK6 TaxID=1561964 RepID=UPI00084BC83D|nr:PRC-barrel domain-containing protein [Methanosphaera sp. WGK6]OED30458.1 photosystem reaction center subunit H [Methanosphaera sp. WGK6]